MADLISLRKDILGRLNVGKLFTLQECKIIIRKIMKMAGEEMKQDTENLMYLNQVRYRVCVDKPIPRKPIPDLGTSDTTEVDPPLPSPPVEKGEEVLFQDASYVMTYPHAHLSQLVVNINRVMVHLIDSIMKHRKRRLLLAATILDDIHEGEQKKHEC
eukprot:gb/GECH01009963.1/.p1 GENE.gb/GECH01009963.1/~~gb/GECH01009963.1/.p1  ORF type:complete len:158 (+),score=8.13 gb/GECH01009963.1/:1-474(+)